jgi:hypothetical protein
LTEDESAKTIQEEKKSLSTNDAATGYLYANQAS